MRKLHDLSQSRKFGQDLGMSTEAYERYILESSGTDASLQSFAPNVLISAKNVRIVDHLASLYTHLLENHYIDCIVGFDTNILSIFSRDVLKKIRDNDLRWEKMVPIPVADAIKRRGLFGDADSLVSQSGHDSSIVFATSNDETRA